MKLGFIGCGKMATALVNGVLAGGTVSKENIYVSDCSPEAIEALVTATGVRPVRDNATVVAEAETILLCVKPSEAAEALAEGAFDKAGPRLVISIVAGLPLVKLEAAAGPQARLVRVMPNTPALIHKGAAAYALGTRATDADADIVDRIFSAVGLAFEVKESLIDSVTGLSGSGPAYVYLMIEALAEGGALTGLPRDLALQLAAQTVSGAAEMVLLTGKHPAILKDMVASPGGTTIAGLTALEEHGVRAAFISAVRAAAERARELGAL